MRSKSISKNAFIFRFNKIFRNFGLVSYVVIIASFILLVTFRAYGTWSFIFNHTGRNESVYIDIIKNDAIIIGIFFLLLYFSMFNRFIKLIKWLVYLFKTFVVFIVLCYAVDVLMIFKIFRRLHYRDVLKYGMEIKAGFSLLTPLKAALHNIVSNEVIGVFFFSIFLLFIFSFIKFQPREDHNKSHRILIIICGIFFSIFSFIPLDRDYIHGWAYENFIAYNMPKGIEKSYSDDLIATLNEKRNSRNREVQGLGKRPNIILLIVESLSSCHSNFFSGINNYTPNLDAIAKENLSLTNFFSNGSTTEHGLIALLLGEVPLPNTGPGLQNAFTGYYQKESIATFLNSLGYKTYFLTTGDLRFTNKDKWLSAIGFDVAEGSEECSFYKDWPRFAFNAAPDEALFAYAIRKISNQKSKEKPYFMVLETVTSHLPLTDPEGHSNTEEAVINYVDRQIGVFYNRLKNSGFFMNGLLIITSDHRIMAPLSKAERNLYGDSAFARIPMVVSGFNIQGIIEENFQQTDLFSSLKWFVANRYENDPWNGNFLNPQPTTPFSILKHMSNDFDMVYFRCCSEEGYIKLQGDDTSLYRGKIDSEKAKVIIEKINSDRIFHSRP